MFPSSRFLQRGMLAPLDFSRIRLAVELGPGTGCITRAILERLSPTARLLALDINRDFVAELSTRFQDPRLLPVHASAAQLLEVLRDRGLGQADCVISGLPYCNMELSQRNQLVQTTEQSLAPGGVFVVFQYSPFWLPQVLRRHFPSYKADLVPLNIPPALVYACTKG